MDAAAPIESHGQLVQVSPAAEYHFHLVFSNKTESDAYCISIWQSLTERRVKVWQQNKNIPKDSENWWSARKQGDSVTMLAPANYLSEL